MTKFFVHQLNLTNDESDAVNKLGWDLSAKVMPRVRAYLDQRMIEDEIPESIREAWSDGHYECVAQIEADDFEGVFHTSNVGIAAMEERIKRYGPMHSVSVGDIIENPATGEVVAVAGFGFKAL